MAREKEHDPLYLLNIRNWSFTVYFSGKRRSLLHSNTEQRYFSHDNLILNAPKGARKY